MIDSIQMGDFVSHQDTRIDLDAGVTVFVGSNGAGKSSVIDAVTFALFGKHTRGTGNKNLIRRGRGQAYCIVEFSIGQKKYRATRKTDVKGVLSAQFQERTGGEWSTIIQGERRQFGESTTKKIEECIGLDFERLKIASIVRQGELNAIIEAKPKEFKELINAVVGIDKLDLSSEGMKAVLGNFRNHIREKHGYDDGQMGALVQKTEELESGMAGWRRSRGELEEKRSRVRDEIEELEGKVSLEVHKEDMMAQLAVRKRELKKYAEDAASKVRAEITQKEKKIADLEGCLENTRGKAELEGSLGEIESELEDLDGRLDGHKQQAASLREQLNLAKKLQLTDGRCPVCDSAVSRLKPIFVEGHLREELEKNAGEASGMTSRRVELAEKRSSLVSRLDGIKKSEAMLEAHSVSDMGAVDAMRQEVAGQKKSLDGIPGATGEGLAALASIDSHTKLLYRDIETLEAETRGFDASAFLQLKKLLGARRSELGGTDRELGGVIERLNTAEKEIHENKKILEELSFVKRYAAQLQSIQDGVFNRDGAVATSLRSWALAGISARASEYLEILNTGIQRIELSEKARNVSITCYSGGSVLDLESLSGGERVGVALSLRLGMAKLLGSSNLDVIILDEPTTHLDRERRASLVRVLSQLSDAAASPGSTQFIIITHDAEIFEDSAVEQIFRFEQSAAGTIVTKV